MRGVSASPNNSCSLTDADTVPSAWYSSGCVRPLGYRQPWGRRAIQALLFVPCEVRGQTDMREVGPPFRRAHEQRRHLQREAGKAETSRQLLVGVGPSPVDIGVAQQDGGDLGIRRQLMLRQHDRAVVVASERANSSRFAIELVRRFRPRRPEPLAFHEARHSNLRLATFAEASVANAAFARAPAPKGAFTADGGLDVDGDHELALAHAALGRQDGSVSRREQDSRRARLAPAPYPIGIAVKHGSTERAFVEADRLPLHPD